jgi:manganese/zinc/iron transport system ATP- binding protein
VPQRETVDWDFPVTCYGCRPNGRNVKVRLVQRGGKRERELALRSLDRVGLADFSSRQIGKLSGRQQQRVFLARALAREADIYLLDEPMAGVDDGSQGANIQYPERSFEIKGN